MKARLSWCFRKLFFRNMFKHTLLIADNFFEYILKYSDQHNSILISVNEYLFYF